MKCPICDGKLDNQDYEFVCQGECGAAFCLEYLGVYEDDDDRTDEGFESIEWLKKWNDKLDEFKFG